MAEKPQDLYTIITQKPETEKRTKRMQFIVKPSTYEALMKLEAEGVFKSKNDLINNFLEEFIAQAAVHRNKAD